MIVTTRISHCLLSYRLNAVIPRSSVIESYPNLGILFMKFYSSCNCFTVLFIVFNLTKNYFFIWRLRPREIKVHAESLHEPRLLGWHLQQRTSREATFGPANTQSWITMQSKAKCGKFNIQNILPDAFICAIINFGWLRGRCICTDVCDNKVQIRLFFRASHSVSTLLGESTWRINLFTFTARLLTMAIC